MKISINSLLAISRAGSLARARRGEGEGGGADEGPERGVEEGCAGGKRKKELSSPGLRRPKRYRNSIGLWPGS